MMIGGRGGRGSKVITPNRTVLSHQPCYCWMTHSPSFTATRYFLRKDELACFLLHGQLGIIIYPVL